MGRELVISKKANAFILSLPEAQRKKIKGSVSRLLAGDFEGLDIKRLQPYPHDFRLRVGGVRILFTSEPERLLIFKAGFRGDVYK
ncbi:type II toxin-antitoxin system RelE family toxin [Solidesulfovibrio sp.]